MFVYLKEFSNNFPIRSDIAVGAPFDGDGKVFIYRGSDSGIETKPAQASFIRQFWNEATDEKKDEEQYESD